MRADRGGHHQPVRRPAAPVRRGPAAAGHLRHRRGLRRRLRHAGLRARCSGSRSCIWAGSSTPCCSPAWWPASRPIWSAGAAPPVPRLADEFRAARPSRSWSLLALGFGAVFGLMALMLIETMRGLERGLRRFRGHPYWVAAGGRRLSWPRFYPLRRRAVRRAGHGRRSTAALAGTVDVAAAGVPAQDRRDGGDAGDRRQRRHRHAAVLHRRDRRARRWPTSSTCRRARSPRSASSRSSRRRPTRRSPPAVMGMELLPGAGGGLRRPVRLDGVPAGRPPQRVRQPEAGLLQVGGLEMTLGVPIGEVSRRKMRVREGSLTDARPPPAPGPRLPQGPARAGAEQV